MNNVSFVASAAFCPDIGGEALKKVRIHPDVIVALLMLLAGLGLLAECSTYPADVAMFPRLFIILMEIFLLVVLGKGIHKSVLKTRDDAAIPESEWWCTFGTLKYPIITTAMIIIYVAGINYLGMYLMSIIYSIVGMRFFGEKRWPIILGVSIGMQIFLWALIEWQLGITLPRGVLFKGLF